MFIVAQRKMYLWPKYFWQKYTSRNYNAMELVNIFLFKIKRYVLWEVNLSFELHKSLQG